VLETARPVHLLHTLARDHQPDTIALLQRPIHHSEVNDHTPVGIVVAIKNECSKRFLHSVLWGRHLPDDRFENVFNADAFFSRCLDRIATVQPDNFFDLLLDAIGLCTGKVNFV
jgi:hypothetical protein